MIRKKTKEVAIGSLYGIPRAKHKQYFILCLENTKNKVFYVKNTSAMTILKTKRNKEFAKDTEMILEFNWSYSKRQCEFYASVL